jgi:predicted RecB family nuclease
MFSGCDLHNVVQIVVGIATSTASHFCSAFIQWEEDLVTSELLEAHLACPTKCYLRSIGEVGSGNTYAAWNQTRNDLYRREGMGRLTASTTQELVSGRIEPSHLKRARWQLALDQLFRSDDLEACIHAVQRTPRDGKPQTSEFTPIRFIRTNKLSRANRITAGFEALVLSKSLGRPVGVAKIIHGDDSTEVNVRVGTVLRELTKAIGQIRRLLAEASPPDLVLNRHCPECQFRDQCRKKAIEKDDLSLLAGLTDNERTRLNGRGIFTVNQLSYTFRPRRRAKRLAATPEKYHHSLKALALRQQKIHFIGNPQLRIDGTPVFLDVESLPDREFYYLVGIRLELQKECPEIHSLWANSRSDERRNWSDFLAILSTIEKPTLIHYGSFETKFLKKMCDRYGSPPEGTIAAEAISSSLNLLSLMFAKVYFPSYSNGLKENARFLGFEWTDPVAGGLQSIAWRHLWEESKESTFQEKLIAYNTDDCAALSLIARTLNQLTNRDVGVGDTPVLTAEIIDAGALEDSQKSKWRPFKSPISDLEKINLAARWDYQRDRVFVRSGTANRRVARQSKRRQPSRAQQIVVLSAPRACPKCQKQWPKKARLQSRTVQDLVFGKDSIKRRIIQYVAQRYCCRSCGYEYGQNDLRLHGRNWGWNILAYFVYHIVGLRIPQLTVQHSMNRLFGCHLVRSSLNEFKIKASGIYSDTKAKILDRIINGNIIHADETRANIRGHSAYVWVLTSVTEVVYILAESREGEIVQQLLKSFKGVLVSDFYAAYDSIECPQQKCLIHLMRDLNDEILNNPFDQEAKLIALRFAALLKPIVETIDRRGLKTHFLRKHLREVDRFYGFLDDSNFNSDVASKLKQRFKKNRDKLFTFLRYDGVPWNNNNAEHAIKAFARLRDVISGLSTKKGLDEYVTLLSVSETCKYRGIDFLDFLRSGERDVALFAPRRRRSK